MSTQQSQKSGVRSEGQKQMRAREGHDPLPASKAVRGAFAGNRRDESTDEDVSLKQNARTTNKRNSTKSKDR